MPRNSRTGILMGWSFIGVLTLVPVTVRSGRNLMTPHTIHQHHPWAPPHPFAASRPGGDARRCRAMSSTTTGVRWAGGDRAGLCGTACVVRGKGAWLRVVGRWWRGGPEAVAPRGNCMVVDHVVHSCSFVKSPGISTRTITGDQHWCHRQGPAPCCSLVAHRAVSALDAVILSMRDSSGRQTQSVAAPREP